VESESPASPLPAHSIIRRASFMRLPGSESHVRMNCEQDFGDGGMNVTLTLRLLMHGKVNALRLHKHLVFSVQDDTGGRNPTSTCTFQSDIALYRNF